MSSSDVTARTQLLVDMRPLSSQSLTSSPFSFQRMILQLMAFWDRQGCVLAQPYDLEMGAGTSHPLTALYALGSRPWRTAFVQPCRRPADGRYGDNPNRLQRYYQFQVFLKPAPANPQELLLESYKAIGIDINTCDIRFVEDDWENPSLGAAGLGWEVWLNGMEITQFTYFQQMGGLPCEWVGVELTYGLERLAMAVQGKNTFFDLAWNQGDLCVRYGDLALPNEKQFCTWYFQHAPITELQDHFTRTLAQGQALVEANLVLPAYDHCIQANHSFNMLDARGAISVTQRAGFIARIRHLASQCCEAWHQAQPLSRLPTTREYAPENQASALLCYGHDTSSTNLPPNTQHDNTTNVTASLPSPCLATTFLWELGTEEIPAGMQKGAVTQLEHLVKKRMTDLGLTASQIHTWIAARRLVFQLDDVHYTPPMPYERKGPSVHLGETALAGFCKSVGVDIQSCVQKPGPHGPLWYATVHPPAQTLDEALSALCTAVMTSFSWPKAMRWQMPALSSCNKNAHNTTESALQNPDHQKDYVDTKEDNGDTACITEQHPQQDSWVTGNWIRPIRWIVALVNDRVLAWAWQGLRAQRHTWGHRLRGNTPISVPHAQAYHNLLTQADVCVNWHQRCTDIAQQVQALAASVHGHIAPEGSQDLVQENAGLAQKPHAILGTFDPAFLQLPAPVITTALRVHQKSFCLQNSQGDLLPAFVVIADGDFSHLVTSTATTAAENTLSTENVKERGAENLLPQNPSAPSSALQPVRQGYEQVVTARLADALFFWQQDRKQNLANFVPLLAQRAFFQDLGSMAHKVERCQQVSAWAAQTAQEPTPVCEYVMRTAALARADLACALVGEFPSLQGVMGQLYAYDQGEHAAVVAALPDIYTAHKITLPAIRLGPILHPDSKDGVDNDRQNSTEDTGADDQNIHLTPRSHSGRDAGANAAFINRPDISSVGAFSLSPANSLANKSSPHLPAHTTRVGAYVAVADSIDTLVGLFAVGKAPSGSKDPMALRRTANGLIRALLAWRLPLSLNQLGYQALQAYHVQDLLTQHTTLPASLTAFLQERAHAVAKEAYGWHEQALAYTLDLDEPLGQWAQRCQEIHQLIHTAPTFLQAYGRLKALWQQAVADNIVDASLGHADCRTLDEHCARLPGLTAEQTLYDMTGLPCTWSFNAPLDPQLAAWTQALNQFFDQVLVHDPDYQLPRLALVARCLQCFRPWLSA